RSYQGIESPMNPLAAYEHVQLVDFEFCTEPAGRLPKPVCMVAHDLATMQTARSWLWDEPPTVCPVACGPQDLLVAYHAPAELSCYLALGWDMPENILDLCAEFKRLRSGLTGMKKSMADAMNYYGLDCLDTVHKTEMQMMAARGGPYTDKQREGLL